MPRTKTLVRFISLKEARLDEFLTNTLFTTKLKHVLQFFLAKHDLKLFFVLFLLLKEVHPAGFDVKI